MTDAGRGESKSGRAAGWVGGLVAACGLFPILAALDIVPVEEASLHAPRWVVAGAGLGFVLAGLALVAQPRGARAPGPGRAALQHAFGLGTLGCLALVFNWVAFGPGTRQCGGGLSLGVIGLWGPAGEATCRAAFALGAMLGNVILAWGTWHGIRQYRDRGRR